MIICIFLYICGLEYVIDYQTPIRKVRMTGLKKESGGSSYSAVDGACNPIALTPNGGDSYTLTMPASDVTISAN